MTHMPPDGGSFSRGGMEILDIAWFLLMLAAFAALVTFGVLYLRRTRASNSNPGKVLDMRLAKGEIDLATYNQIAARIGAPTKASAAPGGLAPGGAAPDATVTLGAPPAPASAPLTAPPAPAPEAGSIQPSTGTQPEDGTPETPPSPTGR